MTVKQLNQRLEALVNAHAWSRNNDDVKINACQRICISQERSAIMQLLEDVSFITRSTDYKVDTNKLKYQLPDHLNRRVIQINSIIKSTKWERPKYEKDPY